jgi:hypothetical protein
VKISGKHIIIKSFINLFVTVTMAKGAGTILFLVNDNIQAIIGVNVMYFIIYLRFSKYNEKPKIIADASISSIFYVIFVFFCFATGVLST